MVRAAQDAESYAQEATARGREAMNRVRERAREAQANLEDQVISHPVTSIVAAASIGAMAGMIFALMMRK